MERAAQIGLLFVAALVAGIWAPVGARAQPSENVLALTGSDARTWVFERFDVLMGGSARCTAGETWRFTRQGAVEVQICKAGRTVTRSTSWTIVGSDRLDTVIEVDDVRYHLRIWTDKTLTYMRLRSVPQIRTQPRESREFLLEEIQ